MMYETPFASRIRFEFIRHRTEQTEVSNFSGKLLEFKMRWAVTNENKMKIKWQSAEPANFTQKTNLAILKFRNNWKNANCFGSFVQNLA